ncbi:MAG TPA: EamA family transporter, partial [Pirellulaceae bacterium]
ALVYEVAPGVPLTSELRARRWLVILAFATVYLVWGSTYLAIRFCVETIPPLLVGGIRFLLAGSMLYGLTRYFGASRPTFRQWRSATLIGGLLLVGGNGLVCWAEQSVPSGMTSLIVATMPLWMVSLDVIFFRAARPTRSVLGGLSLGLVGVAILLGRDKLLGHPVDPWGAVGLLSACCCWAWGSLLARKADLPASPFVTSALEMLTAGGMLLLLAVPSGDWSRLNWDSVTEKSLWSLAYLIVFGSMLALSAYAWLLKNCDAALVSTYAYVNPIVAVTLGATIGREPLSPRIGLGALLILMAIALVGVGRTKRKSTKPEFPGSNQRGPARSRRGWDTPRARALPKVRE